MNQRIIPIQSLLQTTTPKQQEKGTVLSKHGLGKLTKIRLIRDASDNAAVLFQHDSYTYLYGYYCINNNSVALDMACLEVVSVAGRPPSGARRYIQ